MSVDIQPPDCHRCGQWRLMKDAGTKRNSSIVPLLPVSRASSRPAEVGDIAAFRTSFPCYEEISSERPEAVKGGPNRRRRSDTLDGLGPFREDSHVGKGGTVTPIRSWKR